MSGCVILITHIGTCTPAQVKRTSAFLVRHSIAPAPYSTIHYHILFSMAVYRAAWPLSGFERLSRYLRSLRQPQIPPLLSVPAVSHRNRLRKTPQSHPTAVVFMLACYVHSAAGLSWFMTWRQKQRSIIYHASPLSLSG